MPACGTGNAKRSWPATFSPKSTMMVRLPIATRRNCRRNPSGDRIFCPPRTPPNEHRSVPAAVCPRNRRKRSYIDPSPMSVAASIRQQLAPIHPEGYPFIGGFVVISLVLFWLWPPLGWLGVIATLWCVYFFRDPLRVTPIQDGIVVAPADGRICQVVSVVPPRELELGDQPLPRISLHSRSQCHCCRTPSMVHIRRCLSRASRKKNTMNASLQSRRLTGVS